MPAYEDERVGFTIVFFFLPICIYYEGRVPQVFTNIHHCNSHSFYLVYLIEYIEQEEHDEALCEVFIVAPVDMHANNFTTSLALVQCNSTPKICPGGICFNTLC